MTPSDLLCIPALEANHW